MYQPYPPPPPPRQKTSVGVWILVAWFVGPVVLLLLCCGGLMLTGVGRYMIEGPPEPIPTRTTIQPGPPQETGNLD